MFVSFVGAASATTVWNPAANGIFPPAAGDWGDANNWTNGLPDAVEKAVFNVPGAAECQVSGTFSDFQLVQGDGNDGGVIRIMSGGTLTTKATWSSVGYNDTGHLIVEAGGTVNFGGDLWIGDFDGTLIDIIGTGVLTIPDTYAAVIYDLIAAGKIVGDGIVGNLIVDLTINPGFATVMVPVDSPYIYVDVDAAGANNGQSWADAYTSLPYALDVALYGYEIWVAQGTYRPNDGVVSIPELDERELTFQMKNGVTIEGGYAGFGEPDPDARDMKLYETILNGDLNGDDGGDFTNYDDNIYHIVTFDSGVDASTILDGLTIRGGAADLDGRQNRNRGGGIVNPDGDPTLINCIVRENRAHGSGGMDNGGSPTLIGCTFMGNKASGDAAGAFGLCGGYGRGTLMINCIFTGNTAEHGGAILVDGGNLEMINCTLSENYAEYHSGGIDIDGCNVTLTNCILWGNSGPQTVGDIPVVSYSNIQGGWPGVGNIDVDPGFADPNGVDGIAGTQDDSFRLSADSLCIDAGDNSAVTVTTDMDGNQRIVNNFVDIGAYEFQGVHEIHVDDDAVGDPSPGDSLISDPDENGTAAHPFDTIQEAIDIAKDGHAVLVMPGLYVDPNSPLPVVTIDKNITLTSIDSADWDIVNDTVIAEGVSFSGTEDPNCKLTGFKVQSSLTGSINGNGTQATISNCIITGNGPCLATVINDCDGIISNCLITDNTTFAQCGVFPVVFGCNGVIRNCTIANNDSGIGDWSGGSMTLENCIIYNNGDVADPQVSISGGGMLNVSYCNIQDGSQGVDSDGTVNWGWGNIDVDPLFVRWGLWDYGAMELAEGNYHLQSLGWRLSEYDPDWTYDDYTSRCIDAGNPGSPLANELMSVPRDPENDFGINLRVNMGAYGGTIEASMQPHGWMYLADINNDGIVNLADFANQAQDWMTSGSEQPGDLSRDGMINLADVALLAQDWLQETDWAQ